MHLLPQVLLSLAYLIFSSILFSDLYNLSFYLSPSLQFCCLSRTIFHCFLWLMFKPFFIYIKTNFSAFFPMYLPAHPVMPPFILPLCQHRAFTHYVSHCLIHFTTQSTLTFTLSFVYFCLYCVCSNSFFMCCHN